MPVDLRLVKENELLDFVVAQSRGFGRQFDTANFETYRPAFASAQALDAYEDGRIVGTTLYNLNVMYGPGRMLSTALLDYVTVQPTHRRQGILTQMMTWLMNDLHEREVVLSAFGASESVIYGRFGYGPASFQVDFTLDRRYANFSHFPDVTGSLRFIDKAEARKICPIINERACSERPGYLRGTDEQWDLYIEDPATRREGFSGLFMVVYEEDGDCSRPHARHPRGPCGAVAVLPWHRPYGFNLCPQAASGRSSSLDARRPTQVATVRARRSLVAAGRCPPGSGTKDLRKRGKPDNRGCGRVLPVEPGAIQDRRRR